MIAPAMEAGTAMAATGGVEWAARKLGVPRAVGPYGATAGRAGVIGAGAVAAGFNNGGGGETSLGGGGLEPRLGAVIGYCGLSTGGGTTGGAGAEVGTASGARAVLFDAPSVAASLSLDLLLEAV